LFTIIIFYYSAASWLSYVANIDERAPDTNVNEITPTNISTIPTNYSKGF
jgi:hypothetical protein